MSYTQDRVKAATPDIDSDRDRISPTPILITAPADVFSTTAAVPLQHTKTTHWLADATRVVATSMRRIFLTPTRGARGTPKRYPPRYGYLERARTAREMERL